MNSSHDDTGEQDGRFRLDPTQMPQRLELDIPEELLARLIRQAEQSNRSLNELIEYILAQSCAEVAEES
jgi:predicted HicB family RNase H-like nuclease